MDNFLLLVQFAINNKYYFETNGYLDERVVPQLLISKHSTWEGDNISTGSIVSIFSLGKEDAEDDPHTKIINGISHFPIFTISSREKMFLLTLVIQFLEENSDCYISNANLTALDLITLKEYKLKNNDNWEYE